MPDVRIDPDRFRRDFDRLAGIGATGDGGVHRPALGESHLAAREWFRRKIAEDGLESSTDGAGNVSAILRCAAEEAPTLLLGSHLDSVPQGGRFDGALGVLAAYEALRAVRDAGIELPFHLEAIDFTDEEGTLVGLLGSRAISGTLPAEELAGPRGGRERLVDGLERAGLTEEGVLAARRDPLSLAGYLELHIEQGPRLSDANAAIGVVTGIVGIGSQLVTFHGRADHAGTTPMDERRDAGLGAAALIAEATGLVRYGFPGCVINFGDIHVEPGAYNIVPAVARVAVEYRSTEVKMMEHLEDALGRLAAECAVRHRLELEVRRRQCGRPIACAPRIRDAFVRACETLGLSHLALPSWAGHDTQALASVCPSGMIFIPSSGGSHSAREHAEWDDCVNGANALLHAALHLARA